MKPFKSHAGKHMRVRIDHFIVGACRHIKEILECYEELGFVTSGMAGTVRHQPGLRTGFLYFSPGAARDYIEFITVEDRSLFEAAQARGEREWTENPFAQGLGIRIKDADMVHHALSAQGVMVKPVWSKKAEDAPPDAPWRWRFISLENPRSGLGCFYVEYMSPRVMEMDTVQGPNGIYALGGLLYEAPIAVAALADLTLDLPQELLTVNEDRVQFGCHDIVVARAPEHVPRNTQLKVFGALLYTDSLRKTEEYLKGKWKPYRMHADSIELLPTDFEGLTAHIKEKPISEWATARCQDRWMF